MDPWVGKISWRRAWQPTPGFLPAESPWTEEPGRLQSMGLQRVGYDSATKHSKAYVDIDIEQLMLANRRYLITFGHYSCSR